MKTFWTTDPNINRDKLWRDKHYGRKDKPLRQLEYEWWKELSPDLQQKAVAYLKKKMPADLLSDVRDAVEKYGDEWMQDIYKEEDLTFYSFHHSEGMAVRNLLRDVIADKELPSGNWDDFYCVALELAAGVEI